MYLHNSPIKPMANHTTFAFEHPNCGTQLEVTLEIDDWGSPPSGFSGPPENYDPGSGAEWHMVEEFVICPECKVKIWQDDLDEHLEGKIQEHIERLAGERASDREYDYDEGD